MSQEGFDLLKKDCINSGLCVECGACAVVCPTGAIAMKEYDWGRNPELIGRCPEEKCDLCRQVCAAREVPVTASEEKFMGRRRKLDTYEKNVGVIREVFTGCATAQDIRTRGTSGGVVTALLVYALEKGIIDGCVLAGFDPQAPWKAKAMVATSRQEILACAGSKYQPHPQLLGIKEAYDRGLKKIAVTATPCHAAAVRNMMLNDKLAKYGDIIKLVTSNFCAAHWALAGTKWLLKLWLDLDVKDITQLKYRTGKFPGDLVAITRDGKEHRTPFVRGGGVAALGRFTPEECRICLEKISYTADIALGDTWCHPGVNPGVTQENYTEDELNKDERLKEAIAGVSAIVVRSKLGQEIIDGCAKAGQIKLFPERPGESEIFLNGVTSEKPTWYGPWIEARRRRGQPVRNYI